jgi:hypothetical protein
VIYLVCITALYFGETGILMTSFERARQTAITLERLEWWIYYSSFRLPQTYDATIHTINAWFVQAFHSNGSTAAEETGRGLWLLNSLDETTEKLNGAESDSVRYDTAIDSPLVPDDCRPSEEVSTLHEMYRCSYAAQLFALQRRLQKDIVQHLPDSTGVWDLSGITDLVHMVIYHLTRQVYFIEDLLTQYVNDEINSYQTMLIICYIVEIVVLVIIGRLLMSFLQDLADLFDAAIILLKRLPPPAIVANPELLN